MAAHHRAFRRRSAIQCRFIEALEDRRLLSAVTLNPNTVFQTIQGWGTAAVYPTNLVTIAQAGTIMRDAGMNVVRITPGPNDYTYTVGGNMATPVPISANLDTNVARFYPGQNDQTNLISWLKTNALEPDRLKMIGSLWSPPHWMKITTGTLMTWDNNGTQQSGYDPIIPWGNYGANTGAGRVNPTMWTDWARYVLSTVKNYEQKTGLPMYAFSFQNEPNVPTTYNSASFQRIANDVNNPSAGYTDGHWDIYGDAVQALATELASHPEMTTKFFGPELSQLGGGATNPYNLPSYNAIRQNLISRGLLNTLGAYATHEYTYPADDAVMWDAWYNGSAHAANIANGTNNLGWLGPTPGIAGDNKEIWQTETEGEDQTWTKDGAMGFGLKIYNALVDGNVSGYTSWNLTSYNAGDAWGLVDLADINNPTHSYKYDAFKQFSRWIRPGAQRINATFDNGKSSTGGANSLDTYNGLNVAAFNHAADKRLTMVFVNMKTTSDSTTITIPANFNVSSFQVYQTSGTQKYVQLADLTPVNGQITLTVPASSFVTITGSYATPFVPAPWTSNDIGAPSPSGSANYSAATDVFTLSGSGADIWNNSDQFQFVSKSFSGNGSIIARVASVQNTDVWAKAGVMFRDSTAAGAMFADVVVTPSSGVNFQWRNSTGGGCGYTQVTGVTAPAWIKLVRNATSFTGFYATTTGTPTNSDWIPIGSAQTIPMSNATKVGLAVTSHANGTLCTSTFSGVQINQAPTVLTAAAAAPNSVINTNAILSVLGADDGGEPALNYTWATTGMPPAPVTFWLNGNNAAKSTLATFTKAGSYNFLVTVTDAAGLSVASGVAVTVSQTPTTVTVTPTGLTLVGGATQQYAASVFDQFDQPIPGSSFSWSASGGTISSSGLYSAAQTGGNFSVTATCGSANGSALLTVVPTLYTGGSGTDQYYLKLSGSTLNIWLGDGTGSPNYAIAHSLVPSLSFNGSAGDDSLTVDCSAGNVFPSGGISFDGGNGTDTLKLIGTSGDDIVTANASSVTLGRTISTPNLEIRSFTGGAGHDSLSITGGSWTFDADTLLTTLNLSNSTSASVAAGGAICLQVTNLSIDSSSKLDLQDNALVVHGGDVGSWDGSAYTGISRSIAAGRNGGSWNGAGIMTSQALAASHLTTLAAATAGSVQKSTFAGISVSSTDVLVMYTYSGDANLDGKLNVDDYTRIDFNAPLASSGWCNGDFNYDGTINVDDYTILDFNVGIQGPLLTSPAATRSEFTEPSAARIAVP